MQSDQKHKNKQIVKKLQVLPEFVQLHGNPNDKGRGEHLNVGMYLITLKNVWGRSTQSDAYEGGKTPIF